MIKNYRICVDGQYYTGEKECSLDTWTSAPWSGNTFQTKRVDRNVLTFEPIENNNYKIITGTVNLIGEIKKIIQFVSITGLLSGNEITIEAEPFTVPSELNIDYFLGLESELSRQKQICSDMKNQLDIATDLGNKRFDEITALRNEIKCLSHDNQSLMSYYMGNEDMRLIVADLLERRDHHAIRDQLANALTEIAGLRAKHNDYEHPQDSIDRGNRISQLEIDKINLQSQIDALKSEISTCTECKQPVDCALKAELRKKDAEIERLTARIYTLEDMSSGGKP